MKAMLVDDVARGCKISINLFRALVDQGRLPSPDVFIRNREAYSQKVATNCIQRYKKIGPLVRISHLADKARKTSGYVRKLIKENRLPEPHVEAYASKYYTQPQVSSLLSAIRTCQKEDEKLKKENQSKISRVRANKRHEKRRQMGYFSAADVARMAKISIMTVLHHQGKNIPIPEKEVDGYFGKYYTKPQVQKIIKFFEERRKNGQMQSAGN